MIKIIPSSYFLSPGFVNSCHLTGFVGEGHIYINRHTYKPHFVMLEFKTYSVTYSDLAGFFGLYYFFRFLHVDCVFMCMCVNIKPKIQKYLFLYRILYSFHYGKLLCQLRFQSTLRQQQKLKQTTQNKSSQYVKLYSICYTCVTQHLHNASTHPCRYTL